MAVFVANTNVLELQGLKNAILDTYINSADILVTVKTEAGVEVTGVTWPIDMPYVAASSGDYRAILSNSIALVAKSKYSAFIEVDGGPDLIGHYEFPFTAETRTKK